MECQAIGACAAVRTEDGTLSKKRLWEVGLTAMLLLLIGCVLSAFLQWREQQRRLNAEFITAINEYDVEAAQALLPKGVKIHAKGRHGNTVLMMAAAQGDVALIRNALDRGADIHAQNDIGWTSLFFAAEYGRDEAVRCLKEHGAKVTATDRRGHTPLNRAQEAGHRHLIPLLEPSAIR